MRCNKGAVLAIAGSLRVLQLQRRFNLNIHRGSNLLAGSVHRAERRVTPVNTASHLARQTHFNLVTLKPCSVTSSIRHNPRDTTGWISPVIWISETCSVMQEVDNA